MTKPAGGLADSYAGPPWKWPSAPNPIFLLMIVPLLIALRHQPPLSVGASMSGTAFVCRAAARRSRTGTVACIPGLDIEPGETLAILAPGCGKTTPALISRLKAPMSGFFRRNASHPAAHRETHVGMVFRYALFPAGCGRHIVYALDSGMAVAGARVRDLLSWLVCRRTEARIHACRRSRQRVALPARAPRPGYFCSTILWRRWMRSSRAPASELITVSRVASRRYRPAQGEVPGVGRPHSGDGAWLVRNGQPRESINSLPRLRRLLRRQSHASVVARRPVACGWWRRVAMGGSRCLPRCIAAPSICAMPVTVIAGSQGPFSRPPSHCL